MTVSADRPATLGDLKASGYQSVPVKTELRRNLLRKLKSGEPVFPGILGYEDTVFPQLYNAVLSKHDVLLLGLRGQGKTRMLRMLTSLLDEYIPAVAGSEIHDDPLAPLSKYSRDLIAEKGDDTPLVWIGRDQRYNEKLATPDVTIADLIGEVDLIKHAGGALLSSEDAMHFGLIPRSHRGIFCMNELPDLAPKIQVGLFNVLEERDVQIRGFNVRLNLDLMCVFSANPEDYTNRGRIVTPLKDRIGSVVRTHYPTTRELGMRITEENAWTDRDHEHEDGAVSVAVPRFMKEVVEETSRLARTSPHVNQSSGVSVRMSVSNYENLLSNAERRGVTQGQNHVVARPSDLAHAAAGGRGKVEMSMTEEPGEEDVLLDRMTDEAVKNVFDQYLKPKKFRSVVEYVESGKTIRVGEGVTTKEYLDLLNSVPNFKEDVELLAGELEPDLAGGDYHEQLMACVAEFILEGLHVHNRLNRARTGAVASYGG
ncbi:sigma 54-interacting transcriptional regulator [Alienimonas californiensis]|uniref:Sigma-54 interaction domain protein n=1 Tax=Alienimonas californiensis TaxID=2527989 RepID=A0A517P6E5_9PLAN|nr:sigma 54-interacting transcriptional regulator [Alienimonas californiensis]QDT14957.1 Sigma-54 interaction domain protein [Alienimonas californiensis]